MENDAGTSPAESRRLRDWIDPSRLYNTSIPAGRLLYVWGLACYPFLIMFVLLTASIILLETFVAQSNVSDLIGIVSYVFMLGWFTAAVCICYRRFKYLGMSRRWILLLLVPAVNLIFCLWLLIKSAPASSPDSA